MKEVIKNRIDTIQQSHSAVHYVKTEIGIFPCDWKIAKLSDIAEKVTQTAGTDFYETVSISAGIGFVNQAKKFGKELSGKQYEKYNVLHKGDFSYNKGNSSKYPQGCIYRLKDRETAAVPNVFESFRIRSECADFYDHLFVSGFLNQQLSKKINHGVRDDGLLNLTEKDFYRCLLPVPPLAEQKKISEILDHCDKLIKRCEAKVDEYKSLKKTCLSKMFPKNGSNAPEFRFPGFKDAWEQREFNSVFTMLQNNTLSRAELIADNGAAMNVHYGDILVKFGEVLDLETEVLPYIDSEQVVAKFKSSYLQNGDVVVADTAEDEAVGKCTEIANLSDVTVISGLHTIPLRPQQKFASGYLGYYLNSNSYHDTLIPLMQGTKVTSISKSALQGTSICYPTECREQQQIGAYFRNLDNLITLHQRESEEYTKLKKAMSQLLLTGIVRVNT